MLQNGYRPDVLLLAREGTLQPAAAVEVFVTHEVGEQKRKDRNLPWIEVTAGSVMEEMGEQETKCFEVERDGLGKPVCAACSERLARPRRKVEDLLDRWNVDWPQEAYRIGIQDCWNCGATIPAFDWGEEYTRLRSPLIPDRARFSTGIPIRSGRSTGPTPAPSVIKYRATGTSGKEREGAFGPTHDSEKLLLRRAQEERILS
jgi:hypothetical protein